MIPVRSCLAALALLALPGVALADDTSAALGPFAPAQPPKAAPDVTAVVTVTLASDYVWRGESQNNQKPVAFLEVDLGAHGFYLDGRTENVDFAGSHQEYDNRAGYVLPLGHLKLDLGFIRYGYVHSIGNVDTLEGGATLSGDFGKLNWHAGTEFTRNYFGTHLAGEYYELGTTYQFRPNLAVSGNFAHQDVDHNMHYNTWNLALDYTLRKGLDLTVAYIDSDIGAFGPLGGARAVGSVSFAF